MIWDGDLGAGRKERKERKNTERQGKIKEIERKKKKEENGGAGENGRNEGVEKDNRVAVKFQAAILFSTQRPAARRPPPHSCIVLCARGAKRGRCMSA